MNTRSKFERGVSSGFSPGVIRRKSSLLLRLPLYTKILAASALHIAFLTHGYRNTHYPPHSHAALTTHLIIEGSITLWYPQEKDSQKQVYGIGSRIDVDAGRVHEVQVGGSGCTMVIGE